MKKKMLVRIYFAERIPTSPRKNELSETVMKELALRRFYKLQIRFGVLAQFLDSSFPDQAYKRLEMNLATDSCHISKEPNQGRFAFESLPVNPVTLFDVALERSSVREYRVHF